MHFGRRAVAERDKRFEQSIMIKGNTPALFLILLFLGVAGFVTFHLASAPVDWMHKHIHELPKSEKGCDARGGAWTQFGGSGQYFCRVKTRDAGVKCSNSSQCEGVCLAAYTKPGGIAYNSCSDEVSVYGCFEEFSDGKRRPMCRD
jgi:hypothetical protein